MNSESILSFRTRRRIAKLWGVPPYRVDVQIDVANRKLIATLDGNPPDKEKKAILEQDVCESTRNMKRSMN